LALPPSQAALIPAPQLPVPPAEGAQTTAASNGVVYNTSPDQQRIRAEKDAALAAKVPGLIGKDGKLTIATTAGSIPLTFHATDDKTPIDPSWISRSWWRTSWAWSWTSR
jgi:hypothetical protein